MGSENWQDGRMFHVVLFFGAIGLAFLWEQFCQCYQHFLSDQNVGRSILRYGRYYDMIRYGPYFGFSHKISIIRYGSLFYDMSQILLFTSNIYFMIWQNLIYDMRTFQNARYEMSILLYEFGFLNQKSTLRYELIYIVNKDVYFQ